MPRGGTPGPAAIGGNGELRAGRTVAGLRAQGDDRAAVADDTADGLEDAAPLLAGVGAQAGRGGARGRELIRGELAGTDDVSPSAARTPGRRRRSAPRPTRRSGLRLLAGGRIAAGRRGSLRARLEEQGLPRVPRAGAWLAGAWLAHAGPGGGQAPPGRAVVPGGGVGQQVQQRRSRSAAAAGPWPGRIAPATAAVPAPPLRRGRHGGSGTGSPWAPRCRTAAARWPRRPPSRPGEQVGGRPAAR